MNPTIFPMIEIRRTANGYSVDTNPRAWDRGTLGSAITSEGCFNEVFVFETFESLANFLRDRFAHGAA